MYIDASIRTFANCSGPYFKGVILGQGAVPTNGIPVHFWFYGVDDCKVSGVGESTGEWGFNPGLAEPLKHTHIVFNLQVVNNCQDKIPRSDTLQVEMFDSCETGQFENITFAYNW